MSDNSITNEITRSFSAKAIYRALTLSAGKPGTQAVFKAKTEGEGVSFNFGSSSNENGWHEAFLEKLIKVERLMFLEALLDEMRDARAPQEIQDRFFAEAKDLFAEIYPKEAEKERQ